MDCFIIEQRHEGLKLQDVGSAAIEGSPEFAGFA